MCINSLPEKKYRLADFFESHWDKYLMNPKEPILPEQFKAVNALRACRTEQLGVDVFACTGCGTTHKVYHSCGNRFCPTCGHHATQTWRGQILAKMIDRKHHHITVMLPSEFRVLAKNNSKEVYGALFTSAAEALKQWFWHRFKVTPGIMSVLHTFGDDKKYHVHLHMVVTNGGLTKNGKYVDLKKSKTWFVNYSWLCNEKFKPIMLKKLNQLNKKGELNHEYESKEEFNQFTGSVGQKKWRMNIKESLGNADDIVKYTCR
jgi:RNA polymerase subunit RPABC4/transcription elongation factor Spt4